VPVYARGAKCMYDLPQSVLSAGAVTTMTVVNCASVIPPNSQRGIFNFEILVAFAVAQTIGMNIRVTGSTGAGSTVVRASVQVNGANDHGVNSSEFAVSATQQIDYAMSVVPTAGGGFISVAGYVIPNGDS